jgi:hypothetical protein
MAPMKQFKCRVHSGIFKMPARRGRPPVQCTAQHPCSRSDETTTTVVPSRAADTASAIKNARMTEHAVPSPNAPVSMAKAMAAKKQLEVVGWIIKGRAWQEDGAACAEIIATRNDEFLMIVWKDGTPVSQQYTMWNESNSRVLAPRRHLNFDPSELTDAELADALRGCKVTWWNKISNGTEEAIVPDKLSIEHVYSHGQEDPSMRIVKFCGMGSMFRAFHVGALLSIS